MSILNRQSILFFDFQPENGKSFSLKLIAVDNKARDENLKQGFSGESFSLLFESPKKTKIAQEIYEVNHSILGRFSLFIAPVGTRGNRYEAVINRINIP